MKKIYIAYMAVALLSACTVQKALNRSQPPAAGPAPELTIGEPVTYKLDNGITVLVVENHKLPKVSATYLVDHGPVTEGNKAGVMSLMGGMLEEGTTSMSKATFDEAVDQMGASVSLNASGGSASALTRYFDSSFMLMAQALLHPAFENSSFEKLKSQAITALKSNEKSAKAISQRVVSALSFGVNNPMGEFITEQSLTNISLADVKQFYNQYVSPSRGFLTFVGDITPEHAKALAERAFGNWKGAIITLPNLANVNNPEKTEIDLIDVPNAVQAEITVTNLVTLPLSSPDYFPMLLANNILGGGATGRLFMNLREQHGFTYGAYSSVGSGRFQTTFSAAASVRNDKADSAVAEILHEIQTIRTNKVSNEELQNAKALYNGNFALGLEDPARVANFASSIIINNLPADFYKTYLQKINAVTAEDIQRVAEKYFNYYNTRIVVVGKAAAIKPGLLKLNIPVKEFDAYAQPVKASGFTAPAGITAQDVINKYINAVGGADALKKINAMVTTGKMSMQGMSLDVIEKKMAPNKTMMMISMSGQPVVHQAFNGTTGYQAQMGNKNAMNESEIRKAKEVKGIFEQLYYNEPGYKLALQGTAKVNGKDAYKIEVTTPAGNKTTEYYDVNSGYLLKTESNTQVQGQDVAQTVELSDYKKVGDIMVPFSSSVSVQTPMGNQEFTIVVDAVKWNEGVSVNDFE